MWTGAGSLPNVALVSDTVSPAAVHDRLAAMVPALAEQAAEADAGRHITVEAAKMIREAGAHRLLQPARYGGAEASVVEHVRATATAAEGCVAAGWCVGLWSVHNWMLGHFEPATQDLVWADPAAMISGSIVPKTPFPDDGPDHILIQGRFGFASGTDHADWVLIGGLVNRDGERTPAMAVVERDRVAVDQDSWNVTGLRGSGSKDLVVAEPIRVGRDRLFFTGDSLLRTAPGQRWNPGWLYQAPFHTIGLLALAPPALGAARAALARFVERMEGHRLFIVRRSQRDDPAARLRVAEASAEIDAAERALLSAAERCDAAGRAEGRDPLNEVTIARDSAFAVRLCATAVDRLFEAAGGSALDQSEPLQRLWRDVHAVRSHAVLTWDAAATQYSDVLLGRSARD